MAPSRKKGSRAAAAAAAASQQWKVGDLVLAKMKGFPAWPAMVSEPEKWGFSSVRKKLLVYFYGTKQIAFCNYADIEAFTEEKKKSLLVKRQGKGADFVRAVDEIIDAYDKQQKLTKINLGDEGSLPHDEQLEGSRSKSSTASPEIGLDVNTNHQSNSSCVSTENFDRINGEEALKSSMEGDPHSSSILDNEQTENVSMLDQLRQTPLSNTTAIRKRQRDGSLQSSVMQRVQCFRRSRSSSVGDPCKFHKSFMTEDCVEQTSSDLISNVLHEELNLKQTSPETLAPISAGLSSNISHDDIGSDKSTTISDVEEGSMLDSSCKLVYGDGYSDHNLQSSGAVTLEGKPNVSIKAAILKKKRNSTKKRVANTQECPTIDMEVDMQGELHENLLGSDSSIKDIVETVSKADGDEHLPLVKRARVRMGKSSMEETQLGEIVESRENLELRASLVETDTCGKPSSPINCSANKTSPMAKEEKSPLMTNGCALTTGRDKMLWKVNKFQLKGSALDVEAALPPSKRLHRALEAMSANAAEARDDAPAVPTDIKIISGDIDSAMPNPPHQLVDGNLGSSVMSNCFQSSDNTIYDGSTSGLPSKLASKNAEIPYRVDPDNVFSPNSGSPRKNDHEDLLLGVKDCNGPLSCITSDHVIQKEVLQPCVIKSVEKLNTSYSEGIADPISSALTIINENDNETLQPSKKCYPVAEGFRESGSVERIGLKPTSSVIFEFVSKLSPQNDTGIMSSVDIVSGACNMSESTKSSSSRPDEIIEDRDMSDVAREIKNNKTTPKGWGSKDLAPMKDLIAAAQATRVLSRSTSFPDNVVDDKVSADSVASQSLIQRVDSSAKLSRQDSMAYQRPATDDRTHCLQNGDRSPFLGQVERGFNKLATPVEADVAQKSFEALLCTLSRTKDSISRATDAAIDCAKCGIAEEVIKSLLQHLERESSLHKRVDLFFLVHSITQFSRSQKGGPGDVYLSLVESMLPRLLSAAAPQGNAALENRKQCLKVLKHWLEKQTLPESIVRRHIRELESVKDASLISSYSRRPSRTERAFDDPIREMDGIVDEYGSNTSLQLQHFVHPCLLEDEDGSSDDEKSFEAVTPERNMELEDEKGIAQTPNEKHRHILEDVDGELEMEDVAPSCGVEDNSNYYVSSAEPLNDGCYQNEQCQSLCCAPLPEDLPPSPPPLPSSPPPAVLLGPSPVCFVPQQQLGGSHANADVTGLHLSNTHNNMNQQDRDTESVSHYTHGYGGLPKQMPPAPYPVSTSGPFTSHGGLRCESNFQTKICTPLPNKAYPLPPPTPAISNQFSYMQTQAQPSERSWGSCSTFGDRYQYVHNSSHGGVFNGDRNFRRPIQLDNPVRSFSPATNTGPVLSDKARTTPSSCSRYGPYSESDSNPPQGWSMSSRVSTYSVSASRSSVENPASRSTTALGYWQPR